ncbi:hypothetical protein QBC39DRAFT_360984 [Podospora conica]|nr:hypothetical protein QBC39DRAFT_360984 [Schizothecium conicum]
MTLLIMAFCGLNKSIWKDVRDGKHSHIIPNPEIAVSPEFKTVLHSSEFITKGDIFAIDELVRVVQWGIPKTPSLPDSLLCHNARLAPRAEAPPRGDKYGQEAWNRRAGRVWQHPDRCHKGDDVTGRDQNASWASPPPTNATYQSL